jgi:hypothetical protein
MSVRATDRPMLSTIPSIGFSAYVVPSSVVNSPPDSVTGMAESATIGIRM